MEPRTEGIVHSGILYILTVQYVNTNSRVDVTVSRTATASAPQRRPGGKPIGSYVADWVYSPGST